MRLLEIWVKVPLAQALGWTLFHSLWEGAVISAALAAVLGATRSARARYAAACAALLLLLGGIGFTLAQVMPEGVRGLSGAGTLAPPPWNVPTDSGASGLSNSGLAAIVPWLTPFWILGVWIFALGQVAGWLSVRRMRRRGVCCAPQAWQNELIRLRAWLRVSRPILLLESCLADVPMVIGHLRPAILMPIGLLAGLPAGQIEAILLHELAHIRRYDYLVNLLQRSVESLFFYHPGVWWISRVIRTERENCCDDVVVATRGKAQEYAEALARLEQNRWSGREPAMAAKGGNLVQRIQRLLYPKGPNGAWAPLLAAAILLTTALAAFAAWPGEPAKQNSPAAQRQEEATFDPGSAKLKSFPTRPLAYFRMTSESRGVFEALGRLADLHVDFAPDFQSRPISVELTNVKVEDAFREVTRQTNTFWKPVAANTILVMPANQRNQRESKGRAEASPYDRWLNEEVVYIITDKERAAFLKLTTDEERAKFVEQFWARRNPNPGSPENEFKNDYYRRIAYANKHWATNGPGWKTDRGHMFILYGPPDEIDSHPSGTPYPYEEWRYRYIKGLGDNVVFTFTDRKMTGDYRLAPGSPVKKNSESP